MIKLISTNIPAYHILEKAFLRSHGNISTNTQIAIFCFISPSDSEIEYIKNLVSLGNVKLLIFGKISQELAHFIGLKYLQNDIKLGEITFSHDNPEDHSNLLVRYKVHPLNQANPLYERYFYRFDFTNEWNNLGYGSITTDGSIWSLSQPLDVIDADILANVYEDDQHRSIFASVKEFENASILYINREVGLIDGLDWGLVETFLCDHRWDTLPSLPLICDIPHGYEAIVSARLDCDQSVLNAKPLVDLYKQYDIDISLAISTGITITDEAITFLNRFYENGGALLSHTINHYEFWGDSYQIAYDETIGSKRWLEKNIETLDELRYAVSPFHSNKPYSIQALHDSGYLGFISGIIHNDPEYMISTSGEVPFVNGQVVSHSQQCMLHGDCYHRYHNNISIYKHSFKNHYNAKKLFGYLDHPFGEYDYGWKSEEERLGVHQEYLNYINGFEGVKWMTATEILDFVVDKSSIQIEINDLDELICRRKSFNSREKIKLHYKNKVYTY